MKSPEGQLQLNLNPAKPVDEVISDKLDLNDDDKDYGNGITGKMLELDDYDDEKKRRLDVLFDLGGPGFESYDEARRHAGIQRQETAEEKVGHFISSLNEQDLSVNALRSAIKARKFLADAAKRKTFLDLVKATPELDDSYKQELTDSTERHIANLTESGKGFMDSFFGSRALSSLGIKSPEMKQVAYDAFLNTYVPQPNDDETDLARKSAASRSLNQALKRKARK